MCVTLSIESNAIKNDKKKQTNFFKLTEELIKENNESFLNVIEYSFEWTLIFLPSFKCKSIKNLITFIKTAENTFVFSNIAQTFCKISISLKKNMTKLVSNFFDLIWDFFELCKFLKENNIIKFGKNFFFIRLEKTANACSFFYSIGDIIFETKKLLKLDCADNKNSLNKNLISFENKKDKSFQVPHDVKVLRHLLKITDQIATLALAILFFRSVIKFNLIINTIILISNISCTILKKIYIEPFKYEKNLNLTSV